MPWFHFILYETQWKRLLLWVIWQSSPSLGVLALTKKSVASIGRPQAAIMQEKQIPRLMGSLVRCGRTHRRMISWSYSPTWEITTSVGIRLERIPNTRCGVTQLILNMSARIAQFHSVPLWRLSTSHWTMMMNLTRETATHTQRPKKSELSGWQLVTRKKCVNRFATKKRGIHFRDKKSVRKLFFVTEKGHK